MKMSYAEKIVEIAERYIILLLGVIDKPIPSMIHLEKELFLLSQANSVVNKILEFVPHSYGPYSDIIRDLVHDSRYFTIDNGKIKLTSIGKKKYLEITTKYRNDQRFRKFLSLLKMIRRIYDKLSIDELLLLIYITYPEYRINSVYYEELLKKKDQIAKELLRKGLITEKRYKEIVESKT